MPDDNPYDDAHDDEYDDSAESARAADGTPLFGTASKGNPITDEAAYQETNGEPIVTINPENQPARTYELTERVKERYENAVSESLETLDADHYDMWWQDTTLHVEYYGCVRPPEGRPGDNQSPSSKQSVQNQQNQQPKQGQGSQQRGQQHPMKRMMQQMQQDGNPDEGFVLPREPRPPYSGRQGTVQVQFPIPEDSAPDLAFFDEGLLPMSGFTEFDIQERAKMAPLAVEDVFVEPWADDYPVQTPMSYEGSDDTVDNEMYEVNDFRDQTDSKDKTLKQGQRGNRYHL